MSCSSRHLPARHPIFIQQNNAAATCGTSLRDGSTCGAMPPRAALSLVKPIFSISLWQDRAACGGMFPGAINVRFISMFQLGELY